MKRIGAVLLFVFCTCGVSRAAEQPVRSQDARPPRVALARLVSSIPQGYPWIVLRKKLFGCSGRLDGSDTFPWSGVTGEVRTRDYAQIVADALTSSGFQLADSPEELFKSQKDSTDLAIAANIKDIKADLCATRELSQLAPTGVPRVDTFQGTYLNIDGASGEATLTAEWQLYSRSREKVLLSKVVVSRFEIDKHARGNIEKFIDGAMQENIKAFISSSEFKIAAGGAASPEAVQASAQPTLRLLASSGRKSIAIPDAVGSVVLIMSGAGHGSGFLVSSDGYLMTAEHVVGSDKYVKIRWSDGLDGVGEVIRTDKRRDVALIKTDPRGRQPLALRREAPQAGDTVFAIGAPIDPKLQNTVTRGVVSANRILDGFSFIQSDVTVDPGNSGGPLLDEQGRVLGFTDKGLRTAEAPTGLNFFVPIDDALRFLSAEPQ